MNQPERIYPAYPLMEGSNRKKRRLMTHEFNSFTLKTAQVEEVFAVEWQKERLYDEDFYDYENLFLTFQDLYIKKFALITAMRPKYIQMNPYYFKQMYDIEPKMIKSFRGIHYLHEFARMLFGQR